jgi:tRNA-uridine 2-sulfurtransferase
MPANHASPQPRAPAVRVGAPRQRVVVGLSGGVDSAVTAWLLKQQGHEVVGIFMKNWEDDDDSAYCSSNVDFVDAAAVADVIGIEIEHVNFAADYKDRVFAAFLREYQAGRTPNPDVLCNAEIKFKAFLDHALQLGAQRIATGHYARTRTLTDGSVQLLKGLDPGKDQSYFLHRLNQAQLQRTLFPVGELHKTAVRQIAVDIGLPNARKKDSTGICFIGERPFRAFLQRYLHQQHGPMRDDTGRLLGQHVGLSFYTLGQRQGLGIGGVKPRPGEAAVAGGEHAPWFVARKALDTNTLWVVQGHDHPWLLSPSLHAADVSWCAGHAPAPGAYAAKTRYRQTDAPCTLSLADDGMDLGFGLAFAQHQWAVTPGQSAVLYDGEVCLGGGVIAAATGPGHDPATLPVVAEPAERRKGHRSRRAVVRDTKHA